MTKRYKKELSLKELADLPDEDIDFSDIPEADAAFWKNAQLRLPGAEPKAPVSIRLDRDVLDFFKATGRGYQTRINAVLRSYVEAHRGPRPE